MADQSEGSTTGGFCSCVQHFQDDRTDGEQIPAYIVITLRINISFVTITSPSY
jgi:hypothetical protein